MTEIYNIIGDKLDAKLARKRAKREKAATPYQGSWAHTEQTRPKVFKPSGNVLFEEADKLRVEQLKLAGRL